jgi:tryptophan synthase alpha subunit
MNKIDNKLSELKHSKKLGIMTHVIVGYHSIEQTIDIVKTMEREGVDFVELQIPFSDPLADGPVIMKACEDALSNGIKVKDSFMVMKELSNSVKIPLLFMGYFNTVFNYGVEKFCVDAKQAGASGIIIPDMPLEEEKNEKLMYHAKNNDLHMIRVISPVTTQTRLQKNAHHASGFVYCSARQGTTGVRSELDPKLAGYLKKVKKAFSCPIAVGFGISKKEHLNILKHHADIAVIGSAIISIINESTDKNLTENVSKFLKDIKGN